MTEHVIKLSKQEARRRIRRMLKDHRDMCRHAAKMEANDARLHWHWNAEALEMALEAMKESK